MTHHAHHRIHRRRPTPPWSRLGLAGVIAAVSALTGCASVDAQREALASAGPCCSAAAQPMAATSVKVSLDTDSPVAAFSTGNSRYRVLDLAGLPTPPALMTIRSVGTVTKVYSGGFSWGTVVFPAATFLDADRHVLSTYTEERPSNPSLDCKALLHCGFAMITVAPPAGARYLVLHTPFAKVGQTRIEAVPNRVAADQTYAIGGAMVTIPGGVPAQRTIGMSTGELEVVALTAK